MKNHNIQIISTQRKKKDMNKSLAKILTFYYILLDDWDEGVEYIGTKVYDFNTREYIADIDRETDQITFCIYRENFLVMTIIICLM